jgi:hypothetical protein
MKMIFILLFSVTALFAQNPASEILELSKNKWE